MDFEVIVDCSLLDLIKPNTLASADNKAVLSLINDFEDGKWRGEKFNNFIWDNIADTALTQRERDALKSRPHSLLKESAKKLRLSEGADDISRGSELAEIVLYGVLRGKFGALPVVPKIFYKQNSQDNAKGADSVHIVVGENDEFTLWFGEAKFYKSIEDARLGTIVDSVRNSLETEKLKKENSIILNVSDLNDLDISEKLRNDIKTALANRASIDDLKSRIIVPILLLHECGITAGASELSEAYKKELIAFHSDRARSYFSKQIEALKVIHRYGDIRFHLILFPVPSKKPIVDAFVDTLTFQKKM